MATYFDFFVAWEEPTNYQGIAVTVTCRGARYQNIYFEKYLKQRQKDNNVELFLDEEALQYHFRQQAKLTKETIQQF